MKLIILFFASLMLTACGGGAGGGSDAGTDGAMISDAQAQSNEGNSLSESSTRIEDLSVSSQFDFVGGEQLTIQINSPVPGSSRYYINVCSDYRWVSGDYQLNYDSCALRASLTEQFHEYALVISPGDDSFIAQVVAIEVGAQAEYFTWQRAVQGATWLIDVD